MISFDKFRDMYLEHRLNRKMNDFRFHDCSLMAHTYTLLSDDANECRKAAEFVVLMDDKMEDKQ